MKVLVAEDSEQLRSALFQGLSDNGYIVDQVANGKEAMGYLRANEYDVLVLDLMMPEMSGFDVLRELRGKNIEQRPGILILSALDETTDRVKGLDGGADDYLVKPFSFSELLARVRAISRRRNHVASEAIEAGDLKVALDAKRVSVNDTELKLTPSEYLIIEKLILNTGKVVSIESLLGYLPESLDGSSKNAIEVHMSSIRKKIKQQGGHSMIQTVRGFGYKI